VRIDDSGWEPMPSDSEQVVYRKPSCFPISSTSLRGFRSVSPKATSISFHRILDFVFIVRLHNQHHIAGNTSQ
jgi:hypothetical protein